MLYPPIIETYMPAWDYSKTARVYFAISSKDSFADIAQAQVIVRYQTNNANALNTSLYKNKIKCCTVKQIDAQNNPVIAATAARYYIELDSSDLVTGCFIPNTIYKVQIRFSSKSWDSNTSISNLTTSVSQWSTVCLLKPILVPNFYIVGLEQTLQSATDESTSVILSSVEADFTIVYDPQDDAQTLKYWRLKLYNSAQTQLLADSGQKTVNAYDVVSGKLSIDAYLQYTLSNNTAYSLILSIETKNGYTESRRYDFTAMAYATGSIDGSLDLTINEEDGYAKVSLSSQDGTVVHTNITLRRTSSKSNFTIWEDVANTTIENNTLNWDFYDFTIESGIWYQYGAQTRDNRGRRSGMIRTQKEMGQFDDAFLTEHGGDVATTSESYQSSSSNGYTTTESSTATDDEVIQLKIKYDMNITNSVVNVGESKTDTIGSKYPYVRRNGNMYYHSFPFSFLITAYTDNNHFFAKEKELRDNQAQLYAAAHGSHSLDVITGMYDYTYERAFREKVEAFLYNNKVKLFRSLTEGNMLVKLMNITLTPKQSLGRLLYSVDATAVEIDDPTLERIDYYGIQEIGTYNPNIVFNETHIGQLNRFRTMTNEDGTYDIEEDAYPAGFNLMGQTGDKGSIQTIKSKYNWGKSVNNVIIDDLYLSYLRIEINSEPYLIKNVGGVLTPLDDIIDPDSEQVDDETLLGTLININGTTIIIEYPNNIYEMKDSNVHIKSTWNITPLKDTKMTLDYTAVLSASNDNSRIASTMIYKFINGQLFGSFASKISLRTKIWYKYYIDLYQSKYVDKPYYIKVNSIYTINFDTDPGVVVYVQSSTDTQIRRFVIDQTGELFIDPDDSIATVKEAYFYGRNIEKRNLTIYDEKPKYPIHLDAYASGSDTYIYYQDKWYQATYIEDEDSYDIACNVDALVNYYIQTEKGIY